MNILLIGMMGSGKSVVGRLLAERLGRPFVDTDALVEREAGRKIPELFAAEGEASFRRREAAALAAAVGTGGVAGVADVPGGRVIATGGGAVLLPENRALMRNAGLVVWLDAPADELYRRLERQGMAGRPLLAGTAALERLRALAAEREPLYRETAHCRVGTAGLPLEAVVLAVLRELGAGGPAQGPASPPGPQQRLRVDLGARSYTICVGSGLLARIGPLTREALPHAGRVLVISDTGVAPIYGERVLQSLTAAGLQAAIAVVPAGEGAKNLEQVAALYGHSVDAGLERSSAIVALGGGVVGDLAGFVAATYLRGIPFVQAPTTLLAQVDASVGGKTGVDLPQGKNLVGAFHQPALVVADVAALLTLPLREVRAGLAEVIKHAVIRDPDFFADLEVQGPALLAMTPPHLAALVLRNCAVKAAVVAADEREQGLRAILNFGHTVGHALEAAVGFGQWLHGEAVGVGMLAAAILARETGVLAEQELPERLEKLLLNIGLPVRIPAAIDPAAVIALMERDKKRAQGRIQWVLPVRLGEMKLTADLPRSAVWKALTAIT